MDLVGERIKEVAFPADYVELCFGGPVLRLLLYPVSVTLAGAQELFPTGSGRQLLLKLEGSSVTAIEMHDAQLILHISNGAVVRARIDESDARGPESLQFVPWENGRLNAAAMEAW